MNTMHQATNNITPLTLAPPYSQIDSQPEITILIPAYNESANIQPITLELVELFKELKRSYEILFVDDGSKDTTPEEIHAASLIAPVHSIRLSRNFGKENAITAGLTKAKGKAIIIMDADLQHPVSSIPEFLNSWDAGYEMIYAKRTSRTNESWTKRRFTKLFYKLINKSSAVPIPENALDFRLLDRKVVTAILSLPEKNRFMKGLYNWVGFKSTSIPIQIPNRLHGTSTFNFNSLTKLALTGLTSFSSAPLRIWAIIGCSISLLSILYALIITLRTIFFGADVPGWTTLTVSIMFFGGIQLISIGILGEYIGRIFEEVKARPSFIIAEEVLPSHHDHTTT